MTNKYFILFFLLIDFVSPIVYTCNRNAPCGCSKTNAILNRIVGGESAVSTSWGWSVSIYGSGNQHLCGGVIISPLYIITAAHCVTHPDEPVRNMRVVAGIDELSQASSSIAQVRSIVRSIPHPQYNKDTKANDIAILRLNQALIISNERDTARLCLPYTNLTASAINYPVPDSTLVAIGWGRLSSGSSSIAYNQHLQQVTVNAMSANHRMCRLTIRDPRLQFCAGVINGGKDTCQGDSGGPIMHFNSNKNLWVLAGLTSYGQGCALPDYAGVYTRVSVYLDWLKKTVTDNLDELLINSNTSSSNTTTTRRTTTTGRSSTSTSTSSARNLILSYWSLILLLYVFINK